MRGQVPAGLRLQGRGSGNNHCGLRGLHEDKIRISASRRSENRRNSMDMKLGEVKARRGYEETNATGIQAAGNWIDHRVHLTTIAKNTLSICESKSSC